MTTEVQNQVAPGAVFLGPAPTIVQVAEYLGINKASVYRLLYAGKLKVIAGFARTRISSASIQKFLSTEKDYIPEPAKGRGRPRKVAS